MNPVEREAPATVPAIDIPPAGDEPVSADTVSMSAGDTVLEIPEEVQPYMAEETQASFAAADEPIEVANADVIEDETAEPEDEYRTQPAWTAPPTEAYAGAGFHNYEPTYTKEDDGGFYVTVIQEKNVKQRNLLLLGSLVLMLSVAFGSYLVSLFQKDMFVGAIGDERSLAMLLDDVPMPVDEEEKKPDKEDAGGGGGGGKNDPKPVNQGDLPDLSPNPTRSADPNTHRNDDFELKVAVPTNEGPPLKTEKKYGQWGDPNSRFGEISSGPGSGGGMGSGIGPGSGSGRGSGIGSGSGSGMGSGTGNGIGDGTGSGTAGAPPKAPPVGGVTAPFKILSKPRATYTDLARTNNVQGSVLVKVTLMASGQVGSVTVVRGLPHGLSERAIAAAKQIRFEPKKVNGQPVSVTQTFEYTFSIY